MFKGKPAGPDAGRGRGYPVSPLADSSRFAREQVLSATGSAYGLLSVRLDPTGRSGVFREAMAADTDQLVRHGWRLGERRASAPPWVDTICQPHGAARFIRHFQQARATKDRLASFLLLDGEIRGGVIYSLLPSPTGRFELGFWCEQEYRGRGHIGRGISDTLIIVASELEAEMVLACTTSSNTPACRLLERLDFVLLNAQRLRSQ